jgi:hypothetical protein
LHMAVGLFTMYLSSEVFSIFQKVIQYAAMVILFV